MKGIDMVRRLALTFRRSVARGDSARSVRDWPVAARHYEAVVKEAPDAGHVWVQLGHMRKESGNPAGASEAYDRALALMPDDVDLYLQIGHLRKLMGDTTGAARAYRRSLELKPTGMDAQRELEALGLGRLVEEIVWQGDTTPGVGPQLVFDVSDLVFYIGHHDHLTGIQRVQCCIILAIFRDSLFPRDAIVFMSFDRPAHMFRTVETEAFLALLEDLTLPEDQRKTRFDRDAARHGRLFIGGPLSRMLVSGACTFVLLGAAWVIPDYPVIVANLKREFDARFVMVFHDFIPVYARETCDQGTAEIFRIFADQVIELVDLALCVSANPARGLDRYCVEAGCLPPPRVVTRLGSGFSEFVREGAAGESAVSYVPDEPFVLFVSTVEGRKNHDYVLRIWRRMQAMGVAVPRLLCVGRLGWRSESFLLSLLTSDYLGGKVEILDNVSDAQLDQLYARCLFTVYPSLYEGWGLPVGESLAHGKLCVVSDRASLPEVAGEHGIYVPLDDVDAAVAIVRPLIESDDLRGEKEQALRAGYQPVSWGSVAAKIVDGCDRARRADARSAWPVIAFDREYLTSNPRLDADGLMGHQMMDRVLDAYRRTILPGVASPRDKVMGLAARDMQWHDPDTDACWTRLSTGGLDVALDLTGMDQDEVIVACFDLRLSPWRVPARASLTFADGTPVGEARRLADNATLVQWALSVADMHRRGRKIADGNTGIHLDLSVLTDNVGSPDSSQTIDARRQGFGLRSFVFSRGNDPERQSIIAEGYRSGEVWPRASI